MRIRVLAVIIFLSASACGSELCDEAVARCEADCPAGSLLQKECSDAFEAATENACEAALENFVCRTSSTS